MQGQGEFRVLPQSVLGASVSLLGLLVCELAWYLGACSSICWVGCRGSHAGRASSVAQLAACTA